MQPLVSPTSEKPHATLRPRDAAAIILIDRSDSSPRVLMGRRSSGHVFMPNLYVFPGGRRDPDDRSLPFSRDLHPLVHDKLSGKGTRALRPAQTRALALAAVRELHEETGLRMMVSPAATIADAQQPPDLSCLRYVARAITPPGQIRRFDTRFFCTFTDESGIDIRQTCDSPELVDLQWLDMADVSGLNMPAITRTVLEDVTKFMIGDPSLPFGNPVPFYFTRYGRFIRECV